MTNFLIGKDDEYLISEVIFRRREDAVRAVNIKKCVMNVFFLKLGEENRIHLYTIPQIIHKEKFKTLMPSFFLSFFVLQGRCFLHPTYHIHIYLLLTIVPRTLPPKYKIMLSYPDFCLAFYSSFSIFYPLKKDYKFYSRLYRKHPA